MVSQATWLAFGHTHAPETHDAPFGQAWPQEPQCAGFDARFAQMLPGQLTPGAGQVALQLPPTQNGVPAPQMRPQLPQLFGSLD